MGCQLRFAARRQWRQGHHGVWRWQLEERFGYHVRAKINLINVKRGPNCYFMRTTRPLPRPSTDDAAKGPRFVPLQSRINGSTTEIG